MDPTFGIGAVSGFDPTSAPKAGAAVTAPPVTGVASGPTFVEAMESAARTTIGDLRNAEHVSLKALTGDADIRDVADAVMSAEQNLQAAISIRDKIVQAFLEVSRMQI
ncbi:MAG: flagellar hook-basal body complex protein FliE [Oricola sp.]